MESIRLPAIFSLRANTTNRYINFIFYQENDHGRR